LPPDVPTVLRPVDTTTPRRPVVAASMERSFLRAVVWLPEETPDEDEPEEDEPEEEEEEVPGSLIGGNGRGVQTSTR